MCIMLFKSFDFAMCVLLHFSETTPNVRSKRPGGDDDNAVSYIAIFIKYVALDCYSLPNGVANDIFCG